MKKMNLRGRKFIKKWADRIFAISVILSLIIFSIWLITCEFKEDHNTTIFKYVVISISILVIISIISECISEKFKVSIRREIKSNKAKEWWNV